MRINKWKLARSILLLVVILAVGCQVVNKVKEVDEVSNESYEVWLAEGTVPEKIKRPDIRKVWDTVHKMSHHVIVANDKWGYIDLTEERVNWLLIVVKEEDYREPYKTELLEILERWKAGDFSQADQDHNKVWIRLDGTIGKAFGVYEKGTPNWAK